MAILNALNGRATAFLSKARIMKESSSADENGGGGAFRAVRTCGWNNDDHPAKRSVFAVIYTPLLFVPLRGGVRVRDV